MSRTRQALRIRLTVLESNHPSRPGLCSKVVSEGVMCSHGNDSIGEGEYRMRVIDGI
jgi:hypothetical protein